MQAQRGLVVKGADAVLHGLDLGAQGGQGRAQLVGHVAQPLAAGGLDAAQLFSHGVEGAGQLGQLVVAVHGRAGVQVALRNAACAGGQGLDRGQPAPREPARQQQCQGQPGQARPRHKAQVLGQKGLVGLAAHALGRCQHQVADDLAAGAAQCQAGAPRLGGSACDQLVLRVQQAQAGVDVIRVALGRGSAPVHGAQVVVGRARGRAIARVGATATLAVVGRRGTGRAGRLRQEVGLHGGGRGRRWRGKRATAVGRRAIGRAETAGPARAAARVGEPSPQGGLPAQAVPAARLGVVGLQALGQPVHAGQLDLGDIRPQAPLQPQA